MRFHTKILHASQFSLSTKYYLGDQVKEAEMGRTCSMDRADERGGKRVQITWARKGPDSVEQGLFFIIFEWKENKIFQFFNFQFNSN
jgi:hypothetical protein